MKQKYFILFLLVLSLDVWDLAIIVNLINHDVIFVITFLLTICYCIIYKKEKGLRLYKAKYIWYILLIFAGILISVLNAYFFWGQSVITTFIAQRWIYLFITFPVFLITKPNEEDLVFGLRWISVSTMCVWLIVSSNPKIVNIDTEKVFLNKSDFGYYVNGIHYVILYTYYVIGKLIKKIKFSTQLELILLSSFIFIFQNRSMLIGLLIALVYFIVTLKSKYKLFYWYVLFTLIITGVIFTASIWSDLIIETQLQLNDPDYNRNLEISYYFFEYSPNWICYILGNGFPSAGNSFFGNLMSENMQNGIYASDLGMIGMWVDFGIIPIIVLYRVMFIILNKKHYPFYLKMICFHIIVVPTIFSFWRNPGVMLFSIILYIFVYKTEERKELYASNYSRKLQIG